MPQASIEGLAFSRWRQLPFRLHSPQSLQGPAPIPKALWYPAKKASVSIFSTTLEISTCDLDWQWTRIAFLKQSRIFCVWSGFGEYGGQLRHSPNPSQPNSHLYLTQAAVLTLFTSITLLSFAPNLTALSFNSLSVFLYINISGHPDSTRATSLTISYRISVILFR